MLHNLALPDQPTRAPFNRRSNAFADAWRGLFVDAPAPAGGGGAPAAPAAAAAPAPAPEAKPAAPAPEAKPAAAAAAAAPAPEAKKDDIIAAVEPAKASADDMRKYLVEKGGKDEDVKKLSDADLEKQFTEAKAKEQPAAKPGEVKVEDIKVTVPEGIEIDEKLMGDFKGLIADAKLSPQERAQKLVDLHASALKAAADKQQQVWTDTNEKWKGEVRADKELGGTNLEATRSTISKAITEVMGKDAASTFDAFLFTGAANNPAIVRAMFRMSKLIVEGDPVAGGAPAEAKGLASTLASMYPSANNGAAKAAA
jgi:hypothetical protein